jgi:hypothetical protein
MNAATGFEDRALARRYAFLGFAGSPRDRAFSMTELRAEMGDANASALVIRIGALAQMHHLDKSSMGLSGAVDKIMRELTPDERRSVARGDAIPPRIEAMVTADAQAAKTAAAQAEAQRHNASGAPLSREALAAMGHGAGLARYAQANTGTMVDGGNGNGGAGTGPAGAVSAGGSINAAAASAGVSPQTMGRYMREYSGMGFDQNTIGTFAKVGLGAKDERQLERRWGRPEVVKGAETAKDWGLRGKRGVDAVTAIHPKEREGWEKWRHAPKGSKEEKDADDEINAAPGRPGDSKGKTKDRREWMRKNLHKAGDAYDAKHGSEATREPSSENKANTEKPVLARQMTTDRQERTTGIQAMLARGAPTPKAADGTPATPIKSADKSPVLASGSEAKKVSNAAKPAAAPDKPKETKIGLATQVKKSGPTVA